MRFNPTRLVTRPVRSIQRLRQRLTFWAAAVAVALAAIVFAKSSTWSTALFAKAVAAWPWLPFLVTPAAFAGVVWLTRRVFPGAEGSGIPQVIAALQIPELGERRTILSPKLALGKILMTSLALCGGASVGREGPTVQIGASLMHSVGRVMRLPSREMERALILAGGAAGIAAAFNTPLAGIVFAIEELSRSFEERTSGTVLTAVIIAGFTSMAVLGSYNYFGRTDASLSLPQAWGPVVACGIAGGILGGLFSRFLLVFPRLLPARLVGLILRRPAAFAAACGLGLAVLGWYSDSSVYGTGYEQARALLEGADNLPAAFGLMKLGATALSYISGIPGGIFAPSLAVGAGLGSTLSHSMPEVPAAALMLLGMVGYFTGVVQAPITATIIVVEMTSDQTFTIPLMAAALIAYAVSRLVCPQPLYRTLAEGFLELTAHRRPRNDEAGPDAPGSA